MYISTSLLLSFALSWWLSDALKERSTPAFKEWKRTLKALKAQDRLERQRQRAAHDELWHRHVALVRHLWTISRWQCLRYIWHAPTTAPDAVFNRYVTLAEMTYNVHTMAQPARLPSLILTAGRLPGLPGGRWQQ